MMFGDIQAPVLDRYEDLTQYLSQRDQRPEILSLEGYERLGDLERQLYDTARLDYLGRGFTVETQYVRSLLRSVQLAILGNRGRAAGRAGVMVSGESSIGKTTACLAMMCRIYARFGRDRPDHALTGAIPVTYVEVPAGSSAKAMIGRFAEFYGVDSPRQLTLERILHSVVTVMRRCSTQLVVVDELQNLNRISRGNGESVDVLKSLSNQVPATFVYSGINVHQGALLTGERGNQISRRFSLVEMHRHGYANGEQQKIWNGIVMAFSKELPLLAHDHMVLLAEAQWLHQRSGGNIGTLQRLLVGGAQLLILDGDPTHESLTREHLETIPVDMAADGVEPVMSQPPAMRSARRD
ncbi:TniB family NTP-binding protein [Arthrobacter sp. RAF14]|uniref:TniB family NTP-binding protein n=1 Tax=Arthrobacter sp. RAF14 TaxID=3233051 RepID=UPI003F8DB8A4